MRTNSTTPGAGRPAVEAAVTPLPGSEDLLFREELLVSCSWGWPHVPGVLHFYALGHDMSVTIERLH